MDKHFDALAKLLAGDLTRRGALQYLGRLGGGLLVTLLGPLGAVVAAKPPKKDKPPKEDKETCKELCHELHGRARRQCRRACEGCLDFDLEPCLSDAGEVICCLSGMVCCGHTCCEPAGCCIDHCCPPGTTCGPAGTCSPLCPAAQQCGPNCCDPGVPCCFSNLCCVLGPGAVNVTGVAYCDPLSVPPNVCTVVCTPPFIHCPSKGDILVTGCETNPFTDADNCGNCGVVCPPGQSCLGGLCV